MKLIYIFGGLVIAYLLKNKINDKYKIDNEIKQYFNNSIFLDARSAKEFKLGNFEGSINIPYDSINNEIFENIKQLKNKSNKNIVIYCRSGRRAKIAFDKLKQFGLTDIYYTTFDYTKLNDFKNK